MEVTLKGTPKEIADLVLAVQSQQKELVSPLDIIEKAACLTMVILAKNSKVGL